MTHMLKENKRPDYVYWLVRETKSEPNFNDRIFHGDCPACEAFNMYALVSKKDEKGAERHLVFCRNCGTELSNNVEPYEKPE